MEAQVPHKRGLLGRKLATIKLYGDVIECRIVGIGVSGLQCPDHSHIVVEIGSLGGDHRVLASATPEPQRGGGAPTVGLPHGCNSKLISEVSLGRGGETCPS